MNRRQIELSIQSRQITLFIDSPSNLAPIDDYRDVCFEIPERGTYRAVFFLLPDKNSDDPYATKPTNEWDIPVRWDDPTMLFIPTLGDDSILAAVRYIIDNDLVGNAFEIHDDI